VREVGGDTEHAEDVEDGLLQDFDDNGIPHKLLGEGEMNLGPHALIRPWYLSNTYLKGKLFTGFQDYLPTKKYNLTPSSSLFKAFFLEHLVPNLIV
jgi:hypothetical protein